MEKRKLLIAIGLVLANSSFAQSVSEMTIKTGAGNKTYKISELKNIVVDAGSNVLQVNKNNSGSSETYKFADIQGIVFDVISGIGETRLPDSNLSIYSPANSNLIYVNGREQGKHYEIGIYNANGQVVLRDTDWQGQAVDISGLAKGIYVFKINNTTFKFRK
ncbi:T9SS type A sorting domain-containing protein [Prevotella falsenii]|uniref:T9SS type A sorting domain-containing protein n=1 Tax=Prevotella falsenii TaxID=515414 RepID=UPI00046952C9|nr:T9SS type A sorting domain-containing protein [Prevotella falsenii]